jgi:quinol monooxygenase YgiN
MVTKNVEVVGLTLGDKPFVIAATYLPLRSFWSIFSFIRLSNKVEVQLRNSRGVIRYALKTDIPRKRFWTVSIWSNREDMANFSRSEPHRTAMKKFFVWGTDKAAIAEWTDSKSTIDWDEVNKRLEEPKFHYRYNNQKRLVHAPGSESVSDDLSERDE